MAQTVDSAKDIETDISYYMGELDTQCASEKEVITDPDECLDAVNYIYASASDSHHFDKLSWKGTYHYLPAGCSFRPHTCNSEECSNHPMEPHFNSAPFADSKHRADLRPICKIDTDCIESGVYLGGDKCHPHDLKKCQTWVNEDQCHQNPNYMHHCCRTECGLASCGDSVDACVDTRDDCHEHDLECSGKEYDVEKTYTTHANKEFVRTLESQCCATCARLGAEKQNQSSGFGSFLTDMGVPTVAVYFIGGFICICGSFALVMFCCACVGYCSYKPVIKGQSEDVYSRMENEPEVNERGIQATSEEITTVPVLHSCGPVDVIYENDDNQQDLFNEHGQVLEEDQYYGGVVEETKFEATEEEADDKDLVKKEEETDMHPPVLQFV